MKPTRLDKREDTKHFLAGGIAGCVAKTVVAPFDRVKIMFQTKSPVVAQYSGRIAGVFGAIKSIYNEAGMAGLYRGHSMTLLRIFPYASIQFTSYERYRQFFQLHLSSHEQWGRFLSGALAGATAVTFTYPFDILRTRLIYTANTNGQAVKRANSLREIYRQLRGERFTFYQGYSATMLGIFFYAGSSFYTFETLKSSVLSHSSRTSQPRQRINPVAKFLCGVTAGLVGQTVAYPFDVVRRRMQLKSISGFLSLYNSIWKSFLEILRKDGPRGFFVGLSINYLKVGPSTGIAFVTYEFLKDKLSKDDTSAYK